MGGLLHLIQRGEDWAGCSPAQSPPRWTKWNSPLINGQCTNQCIVILWSVALRFFNFAIKELSAGPIGVNRIGSYWDVTPGQNPLGHNSIFFAAVGQNLVGRLGSEPWIVYRIASGVRVGNSFQKYDTIWYSVYLTCSKKLTGSQLSPPHGINKKIKMWN